VLALGLFVLLGLLGLDDFESFFLLPLRILGELCGEFGGIGFDLLLLFSPVVSAQVVEVVDEEVDEFDLVEVLPELILLLALLVPLLIFCLSGLFLLDADFLVLGAGLPLDEVHQLLLLPVLLLL
jgi:hypothetical protein